MVFDPLRRESCCGGKPPTRTSLSLEIFYYKNQERRHRAASNRKEVRMIGASAEAASALPNKPDASKSKTPSKLKPPTRISHQITLANLNATTESDALIQTSSLPPSSPTHKNQENITTNTSTRPGTRAAAATKPAFGLHRAKSTATASKPAGTSPSASICKTQNAD